MVFSLNFSVHIQLLILVPISSMLKYVHGMVVTIVCSGINNILILLELAEDIVYLNTYLKYVIK